MSERFEIFVDGGCAMCSRESRLLARLDGGRGRLRITDVGSREFLDSGIGLTYDEAMRSIHGRLPDGRIVHGAEVFRRAYDAVGLGWAWAPTGWPVIRPVVDALYTMFARWRYQRRMRSGCGVPAYASD